MVNFNCYCSKSTQGKKLVFTTIVTANEKNQTSNSSIEIEFLRFVYLQNRKINMR